MPFEALRSWSLMPPVNDDRSEPTAPAGNAASSVTVKTSGVSLSTGALLITNSKRDWSGKASPVANVRIARTS